MFVDNLSEPKWFEVWFNSPYYHILYDNRNEIEAEIFIRNLLSFLQPQPQSKVLDLACGKGRHAIFLASQGLNVIGVDLAEANIAQAINFRHQNLQFFVQDMRQVFRVNYFDFIFNFFTSFGYFEREYDNIKTLKSVYQSLKPGGTFVIDFLNVKPLFKKKSEKTEITKNGIHFLTEKKWINGYIIKNILVRDAESEYHFTERVQAIDLDRFKLYFKEAQLNITHVFGNYQLDLFQPESSERLIIVARK